MLLGAGDSKERHSAELPSRNSLLVTSETLHNKRAVS